MSSSVWISRSGFALVASLVLTLGSGCGSSSAGATESPTGNGAGDAPTFSHVYASILSIKCAPCHTTSTGEGVTQGMLDMTTQADAYANLVGVAAAGSECAGKGTRVVPDMPDSSVFYLKVSTDDPAPCGNKMPLAGAPLTTAEADEISSWIKAGALND